VADRRGEVGARRVRDQITVAPGAHSRGVTIVEALDLRRVEAGRTACGAFPSCREPGERPLAPSSRRVDLWQDFVEQRHVCHSYRRLDGEKVVA
jgi:hypothetical protein